MLVVGVREVPRVLPSHPASPASSRPVLERSGLGRQFWVFLGAVFLFNQAYLLAYLSSASQRLLEPILR